MAVGIVLLRLLLAVAAVVALNVFTVQLGTPINGPMAALAAITLVAVVYPLLSRNLGSRAERGGEPSRVVRELEALVWAVWLAVAAIGSLAFLDASPFVRGQHPTFSAMPEGGYNDEHRPVRAGTSSNPLDGIEEYLGLIGIFLAGVTGFYLVLMHRAQDEASRNAEQIRGTADRLVLDSQRTLESIRSDAQKEIVNAREAISQVESSANEAIADSKAHIRKLEVIVGVGGNVYAITAAHYVTLVNDMILPMLSLIHGLLADKEPRKSQPELEEVRKSLEPAVARLRAEMTVFGLAEAASVDQVVAKWEDLQAYEHVFQAHDFSALFRLLRSRLEYLISKSSAAASRGDLERLSSELAHYEQRTRRVLHA